MGKYWLWGALYIVILLFCAFALTLPPVFQKVEPTEYGNLTELEKRGLKVYLREGCFYCHTMMVHTDKIDAEYWGMGRESKPGDYATFEPNALGSQRIGPDLTYVADRVPEDEDWWVRRITDPRSITPTSVMPSFKHLSQEDLKALIAFLKSRKNPEMKQVEEEKWSE